MKEATSIKVHAENSICCAATRVRNRENILVPESLAETLWRLEEVQQGFGTKSAAHEGKALHQVLSRQELPRFLLTHGPRYEPQ